MTKGIAVAGTIVVDEIKDVDFYPGKGMLANILSIHKSTGGCVCNTLADLSRLDGNLSLYALGRVGEDDNGEFVKSSLQKYGINIDGIVTSGATGFTDVMTVASSGERTFFHCRGANDDFCVEDVDIEAMTKYALLHVGYILLMKSMDAAGNGGTRLSELLCQAQRLGVKTSIDMASSSNGDYNGKVTPALKYCNYAVMNEIEACAVAGVSPRRNGKIIEKNIRKALEYMISYGVSDCAVIHAPEGCYAMSGDKTFYKKGSLVLPDGFVKGTVGAGDAFCAGFLYAVTVKSMGVEQALDFASIVAACNLSCSDACSGIKSFDETVEFGKKYSRRSI